MKIAIVQLLILLSTITSFAQLTGYYTQNDEDTQQPKYHIVLDKKGGFYVLSEDKYYKGVWTSVENNKVELKFTYDPIDLFVFDWKGTNRVYFTGFGTRKYYFNMGQKGKNDNVFRTIEKQRDQCPYKEHLSVKIYQKGVNEVTLALDESREDEYALYHYQFPEKYDGICVIANKEIDSRPTVWSIEFRGKKYIINNKEELKKYDSKNKTITGILAKQIEKTKSAEIEKFRKENEWIGDVPIKKIEPQKTINNIDTTGKSILTDECDENYDPGPFHYEPSKQK